MEQTAREKRSYYPGLDGLRAVAILGIVLYHMFPGAVRGGYLGVTVFFVLSGYLLSRSARSAEQGSGWRARGYLLRRVRRIYPALLWVMALTVIALRLWLPPALAGVREETASVLLGWQNWRQILMSRDYFTRITATTPFTHLWSLMVELQYYLLWPLLFSMYRVERREGDASGTIGLLLGLALVSAAEMALLYYITGNATRVYYGTDTRLHALLLGCALGLVPEDRLRVGKPMGAALFGASAGGLLALMLALDGAWSGTYYGLLALAAVLSAALILLCAQPDLPYGRLLGWKPLSWLGRRSYEIYLCMYPALFLLERLRPVESPAALHLLETAVILALASAVHWVTQPRRFSAPDGKSFLLRPALWALVLAVSAGVLASVGAPGAWQDLAALEQSLQENRRAIEQRVPAPTLAPPPPSEPAQSDAFDAAPEAVPVEEPAAVTAVDPADVTMVGDSVMLGALPALQERLPGCVVDAAVSRQVWDAEAVLDALEAEGRLGGTVVLALGTNGTFSSAQGQAIVDRLAGRRIFWVTAYGTTLAWQNESNDAIRAVAAANENVTIIDWAAVAPAHPEWFYSDGIHPEPPGQRAYADLIAASLG